MKTASARKLFRAPGFSDSFTTTLSAWLSAVSRLTNLPVLASRLTVTAVERPDAFLDPS